MNQREQLDLKDALANSQKETTAVEQTHDTAAVNHSYWTKFTNIATTMATKLGFLMIICVIFGILGYYVAVWHGYDVSFSGTVGVKTPEATNDSFNSKYTLEL